MSFASSLYVCFFMIVSLIQAALVVPRAASSSSCATTKTVTTVVTSTPLFTTTVEKIKTAKNAETYTDLYFTTVATAKTTPTVTLAQTTSCVPTGCDCTTSTNCYPGCEAPQKRDVNAAGATGCPTVTSTKVVTASTTSTVSAERSPDTAFTRLKSLASRSQQLQHSHTHPIPESLPTPASPQPQLTPSLSLQQQSAPEISTNPQAMLPSTSRMAKHSINLVSPISATRYMWARF